MKKITFILMALLAVTLTANAKKPTVYVLATGGTIAGTGATEVTAGYTA